MSLPTFFGRATAASAQHVHLATLLSELTSACRRLECGESTTPSESLRVLCDVEQEMQAHFQAEEGDGYFGTLASELPALLPRIAELRADHTRMMEIMTELKSLAGDAGRYPDLAKGAESLNERFKAHERIEADLVREFLLREQELGD